MLTRARARAAARAAVRFLESDAATATLPADHDLLVSRFGVMFFDDPPAAFAHLRAALRPGGRLAFICWRSLAENAWARDPLAALLPLLREPPPEARPDAPGPFAFANAGRTRGILESAGWNEVTLTPFDTGYVVGPTPEEATAVALRVGPLGRLIREQALDPAPIRAVLLDLMSRKVSERGVVMEASCWIVTARA